jgi:hypothetical protein
MGSLLILVLFGIFQLGVEAEIKLQSEDVEERHRHCTMFQSLLEIGEALSQNDVVVLALVDVIGPSSSMVCTDELKSTFPDAVFGVTSDALIAEHYSIAAGIISPAVMVFMDFGKRIMKLEANVLDDYIHVYGQNAASNIIMQFVQSNLNSRYPKHVHKWSPATSRMASEVQSYFTWHVNLFYRSCTCRVMHTHTSWCLRTPTQETFSII